MMYQDLVKYLAPEESLHSDLIEKLKNWRLESLRIPLKYRKELKNDPQLYTFIIYHILDYIALH